MTGFKRMADRSKAGGAPWIGGPKPAGQAVTDGTSYNCRRHGDG